MWWKFLLISFFSQSFLLHSEVKKVSRYEELELFNKIMYLIETNYYREIDTKKLVAGALKGMMETLDPHSAFLDVEYFKKLQDDTKGEFGGLGLEVTQFENFLYVVTPIEDSPAFKAGIKAKDKIVEINHESILGLNLNDAIDKMKGREGTKINLGIVREGEKNILYFDLIRKLVKVNAVKSFLLKDYFALIRISQFQKDIAEETSKAIKELKKKAPGPLKGIILDMRSNPGGLLEEAVKLTSLFVRDGLVVSTEFRDPKKQDKHFVAKSLLVDDKTPMAVIINGSSASAAEIVTGALQDHKRAIVMGTQSFGKGSVQNVMQVDKDSGIKLTVAQYMTPNGRKIQALGIQPDIELPQFSKNWQELEIEDLGLREMDLRNHLTARIETPEEKKLRIEKENESRQERMLKIKAKNAKSKESKRNNNLSEEIFKTYDPNGDFQIQQSINYLLAMGIKSV